MRLTIKPFKDPEFLVLQRISRTLAWLWMVGYIVIVFSLFVAFLVPLYLWILIDVMCSHMTPVFVMETSKMVVTFSFLSAAIGFALSRYATIRGRSFDGRH